jgi:glycosyltransferase involved in cell wall biosynthesis
VVVKTGAAQRVLHLVPPNGGGVDRYVRDLCRHRPQDCIVHACETQCVVEWPARGAALPLEPAALHDLAWNGALGRPLLLHAHSTTGVVRRLCEDLGAATQARVVLTLHDIGFDDAAAGEFEHSQRLRFARAAAARTAPSDYIAALAHRALGEASPCRRVENGVDAWSAAAAAGPSAPPAAGAPPGDCAVAVIGAIGEHKGLTALLALAGQLPAGLRIVVIGYTAEQLMPGWIVPGRLWMHGAFQPDELPGLVARYGARLALFPPGMPESYCYALSDAWMAGLPALTPDQGALAERIRHHGGGALYDPQLPLPALAERVAEQAAQARTEDAVAAARGLASVQDMVLAMNEIYRETAADAAEVPADEPALWALAQQHLDTHFFRKELLRLQGELAASIDAQAHRAHRIAELERVQAQAAQQAERQRAEIDGLHRAHESLQAALASAHEAQGALERSNTSLQAQLAALQGQHQVLQQRHAALTTRLAAPLKLLPGAWRERLVALGRRWLIGAGGRR